METDGTDFGLYSYDGFNRVKTYTNGVKQINYGYNAENLRTYKTVNGKFTGYVWNGSNLAAETSDNAVTSTYTYGVDGITTANINGTTNIYLKNVHGDIVGMTDTAGTIQKTYRYDAFGNEQNPDEADKNPFRYTGEYFDKETDNIYLRNRYYAPSTGRFITEDPIRDGLNWYIYANGNPIFFFDPWGLAGEYISNIPEFQHDDTNVGLRDMFNMHKKNASDSITLVDGGVQVNLNGKSQIYYYDIAKHGSVDGNWMYNGKMIVDAVDFAYRFDLIKETTNNGAMPMIFVLLDGDSKYRSASVQWYFGVNYVNTPIGKVVTWQWFTCDLNAWPEWLDNPPSFEATNVITYEGGGNEKRELLFSHDEDYPEKIYPAYTLKRYNSRRHVVLPQNANKAWVRFSAVFDSQIYEKKLYADLN